MIHLSPLRFGSLMLITVDQYKLLGQTEPENQPRPQKYCGVFIDLVCDGSSDVFLNTSKLGTYRNVKAIDWLIEQGIRKKSFCAVVTKIITRLDLSKTSAEKLFYNREKPEIQLSLSERWQQQKAWLLELISQFRDSGLPIMMDLTSEGDKRIYAVLNRQALDNDKNIHAAREAADNPALNLQTAA